MNSIFHHVKEKAFSDLFFFFSLRTPALSTHTHRILKEAAGSWIAVHLIAILTRHYKNNSANKLGAGLGRRSLRPHLLHPAKLFISRGPQKNPAQSNMTNTLSQSHTGQIHLLYCYSPHHPPTPLSLSPSAQHISSRCRRRTIFTCTPTASPRAWHRRWDELPPFISTAASAGHLLSPPSQEINQCLIERCCVETRV